MKMDSETFGIEKGYGQQVIEWLNEESRKSKLKFEARLYNEDIETKNFGTFEMFSWIGDVQVARKLIIKASKRFKIRVIEGGYKTKEKIIKISKQDYALVRKGDRVIGHLALTSPLFGGKWKVIQEELR